MQALVLIILNFDCDFYIYSFTLDHTITMVLTQKDEPGEHPTAFMSDNLK